jgi:hypothetical protein
VIVVLVVTLLALEWSTFVRHRRSRRRLADLNARERDERDARAVLYSNRRERIG